MRHPHVTVPVQVGLWQAEIDKEIAGLIEEIWKAGIFTHNSCQENHPGIAWIQFANIQFGEQFLSIISDNIEWDDAEEPWETLYGWSIYDGGSDWTYDCHPFDESVEEYLVDDEVICEVVGPAEIGFTLSVRFPITDIPLLTSRLRDYNSLGNSCRQALRMARKGMEWN